MVKFAKDKVSDSLEHWITAITETAAFCEKNHPGISKSPVGWHIAHALLTIDVITGAIRASNPADYRWAFNWKRSLIYAMGRIPRGRVKAPRVVQPTGQYDAATLHAQGVQTLEHIRSLDALHPNHFFTHPYFGMLNVKPSKEFLILHTKHHYKIITDILSHCK